MGLDGKVSAKAKEELDTNTEIRTRCLRGYKKMRYCPGKYNIFLNIKRGEIAPPTLP